MLNPPLSLLSDYLLSYIVDHVAELPSPKLDLYNLSITDRAFTRSCQAYIFKDLRFELDNSYRYMDNMSRKLTKMRNILNDEPSFANRVRTVRFDAGSRGKYCDFKWLFNNPNFITIIQHLTKSLMPPHKLHLTGYCRIEDPIFVVEWLTKSFFSQTLTVLNLTNFMDVPTTIFLVCPNLREVSLNNVEVFEPKDDEYPASQRSGRELPALEYMAYRHSGSLVEQMITPPPGFSSAVVDWSKLRVLKLCPVEKKGMVCLQPILNAACNTLEELYLSYDQATKMPDGKIRSFLSM